jgi:hypothetical protein
MSRSGVPPIAKTGAQFSEEALSAGLAARRAEPRVRKTIKVEALRHSGCFSQLLLVRQEKAARVRALLCDSYHVAQYVRRDEMESISR